MAKKTTTKAFSVTDHQLVPKHIVLSEKQKDALLKTLHVTLEQLPAIRITDPGLTGLDVKEGDIIKIERNSPTAGKTYYYRRVIHG